MDSITHLFLGGAIAAAMAPARYRRQAILAGAAINTLPDLDVIPLFALSNDPVVHLTWHRAATHSLLVLPFVAWALWWLLKSRWTPVREEPRRWFWLVLVTLLAHPLIDAFTVYGTQLLWPLPLPPAMWSSLFIIDPLFTLPLAVACVLAWIWKERPIAGNALKAGLSLAGLYLAWSLAAKVMVDRAADAALAAQGLQDTPRFSVPMPFNTLLWRVVAMTPDGYVEGERSLVADRGPMQFHAYRSDVQDLAEVEQFPMVARLLWFNHNFMKAEQRDGRLVLSDLRMGAEPDYNFRFAVAERHGEAWREIPVMQMRWPWNAARRLPSMWQRIWAPAQAAAEKSDDAMSINPSK
jgi:inner membrane protein